MYPLAFPHPAVYIYRLALEWARLWADDREAMSFKFGGDAAANSV